MEYILSPINPLRIIYTDPTAKILFHKIVFQVIGCGGEREREGGREIERGNRESVNIQYHNAIITVT